MLDVQSPSQPPCDAAPMRLTPGARLLRVGTSSTRRGSLSLALHLLEGNDPALERVGEARELLSGSRASFNPLDKSGVERDADLRLLLARCGNAGPAHGVFKATESLKVRQRFRLYRRLKGDRGSNAMRIRTLADAICGTAVGLSDLKKAFETEAEARTRFAELLAAVNRDDEAARALMHAVRHDPRSILYIAPGGALEQIARRPDVAPFLTKEAGL